MLVHKQSRGCQDALDAWRLVRQAVAGIADRDGLTEADALVRMVEQAAERGLPLRTTAQELLTGRPEP
jgi:AmiR/NasT family two-component response regulator